MAAGRVGTQTLEETKYRGHRFAKAHAFREILSLPVNLAQATAIEANAEHGLPPIPPLCVSVHRPNYARLSAACKNVPRTRCT